MKFTFTDTQARDYQIGGLNIHCEPGQTYGFDAGDGRFEASESAPQVDSEPVTTRVREGDV